MSEPGTQQQQTRQQQPDPIQNAQTLLKAKDDTSRFVGLALLKSVLDNSSELRNNQEAVRGLWKTVPSKFLDRLIKTGSRSRQQSQSQSQSEGSGAHNNARDMLDLAVAIIHTFAALMPEENKRDSRFTERIPNLVACLLNCSPETTKLVLETLSTLVTTPDGALAFISLEDVTTLIEIAPSQPLVLDIFFYAWLNAMTSTQEKNLLRTKIDTTITALVSSFKGTDAVTLLDFLANLLPRLEPQVLPQGNGPQGPQWLPTFNLFIRNLVSSRPTPAGRAAYTNLSAALLEVYPSIAPQLLFTDDPSGKGKGKDDRGDKKPFSYLLISILLIDIRSTSPTLLSQLNNPASYPSTSRRLSSAFNIISHYLGFLLRSLDSDDDDTPVIDPEFLLKLRTSLSETFSLTLEFLRDRFDASVAGAMGLDPSARSAAAHDSQSGASRLTLAWESMSDKVDEDPLILAAMRALAIWLREDDNEQLRKEASGLGDLFIELYRSSCQRRASGKEEEKLDFRRPILMAWEGLIEERKGVESFLVNGGWQALSEDLVAILQNSSTVADEAEAARGTEIVRVLLQVAEQERPGPKEEWLDLVTKVAAWYVPDDDDDNHGDDEDEDEEMHEVGRKETRLVVYEFQVATLQLVTALLVGSHQGVQRRYVHSTSAVLGIARVLMGRVKSLGDGELVEALEDVEGTLGGLR
ncbi:Neurochondrin-domain-containing protein [Copromyces sp. CBS 386.78]|nr:Neurochondrin-domain-containing protein [Copromyces sp. CBS 386.78]